MDSRLKILVVDDLEAMRKILNSTLQKMGYLDVRDISSGKQAWDLIQEAQKDARPFKLIISSWNMDLLKLLRADDKFKRTPVLMIFSDAEQIHVAEAVKAGVTNFLMKPFSMNVLEEKINKIFP